MPFTHNRGVWHWDKDDADRLYIHGEIRKSGLLHDFSDIDAHWQHYSNRLLERVADHFGIPIHVANNTIETEIREMLKVPGPLLSESDISTARAELSETIRTFRD